MLRGRLRPEVYPAFAAYLANFVDAYAAEGIPIFALTIQNEPDFQPPDYPDMKLNAHERARIIGQFLGPLLAQRPRDRLLPDWDHNWINPASSRAVLADPVAAPCRSRGVVLWNLALDEQHGPHAGGCADCRGVVTIDSATGAITRKRRFSVRYADQVLNYTLPPAAVATFVLEHPAITLESDRD